jgi:hypothetical protein
MVNGKELNYEEYGEYLKQQTAENAKKREEAQRLIGALGDAYKTCTEFLAQNPSVHYKFGDGQAQDHKLFQKLRENLERADTAPRCEKVREDGTVCGSPQMRGYRYCYAHERMLQTQSQKLKLPAQEDGNGIQMAIMRVQKALIDDEISEKKAGLLLYSLQMASSNLKHTSFTSKDKEVVTEMVVSPSSPTSRVIAEIGKSKPFTTEDTEEHKESSQGETLPQINADKRRSGKDRVIRKSGNRVIEKQQTVNHEGHEGTQRKVEVKSSEVFSSETHAKLG